ncbi:solute carrier family 2, facilitated glucose transporter member 6-like [Ctenocephalides felis]|uniref:solute carrier family 2, facilitated glucose transporter member 6-like n=1 Tax=Ctenocephalides felis TaxID=7515 RepID=UPI000E6E36F9|nr:solute carrier family 2, facilitated glucose transporter member 6-like [Ctenocephalides felis]
MPEANDPLKARDFCTNIGAFAAGTVLAWTSPAAPERLKSEYKIEVSTNEYSLIGSIATVGLAASCLPTGILIDIIGRKLGMLIMVIPFILGWALITWAANVGMMVAGRFIIGFSGGTFCVAAPIYTAEICESEIRGALGSYFSLMLAGGILYVYIIGSFINLYILTIMCLLVPIIFAVTFFFMPESPMFLISKGKTEQAAKSLQKLRGKHYNIEGEMRAMQQNRAFRTRK